jgi:hypothetical protein
MKKYITILFTFVIVSMISIKLNAQLKVTSIGRVHVGNEMTTYDPTNLITLGLFGRGTDTYRAGSKLAFGDFGQVSTSSVNVFVGEEGTTDSEILQLHGNSGVSFSVLGTGDYFVGRFQTDGKLHVRNLVVASSTIFSDANLKENVLTLDSSFATKILSELRPVRFDWLKTEYKLELEKLQALTPSTDKEMESVKRMEESFNQQILEADNHFGFIAQEVQSIVPNLVVTNQNGMLSVNYIELIPLLVKGLQEKQAQISDLQTRLFELEKIVGELKK